MQVAWRMVALMLESVCIVVSFSFRLGLGHFSCATVTGNALVKVGRAAFQIIW